MNLRTVVPVVALLVLALTDYSAAARVLQRYDIDSLVFKSKAIIQAELGASQFFHTADGDCSIFDVTVKKSFAGDLTPGQTIRVAGVDELHRAPEDLSGRFDPLKKGDVVYLFLLPTGTEGYAKYRLTDAKWAVIESGARLISAGQVYAFGQYFPRNLARGFAGPISGEVQMSPLICPGAPVLSEGDFEKSLGDSQKWVDGLRDLLAEKPQKEHVDRYVDLLRRRRETLKWQMALDDRIGALLAEKIGSFGDRKLLEELLTEEWTSDVQSVLKYAADATTRPVP